jgi:O-antigen/teichoic acid export membrane protein
MGGVRLFRSASWLLAERVVKIIASFVSALWVARYLGPEQYGALAFATSWVLLFSEVATLGLNALLAKALVEAGDNCNRLIGTALVLRLVAGALVGAAAVAGMVRLAPDRAELPVMVAVLAVGALFRAGEVFEQYHFAREEMRPPAVARIGASSVHLLLSVGMILARVSVVGFAVARVVEVITMNLAFYLGARRLRDAASYRFDAGAARSLLATSWPLILSGVGATLNLKVDQVMLGGICGAEALGQYAVAAQLSEVWFFVPTAFMTAALPLLVRLRMYDRPSYDAKYATFFSAMLWLAVAAAAVIAWSAGTFVPLLFGPAYASAAPILVIHVWGGLFVAMRAVLSKWIVTEGVTTVSLVTHGLGAVSNIVANAVLIPNFCGTGAAFATVFSYAVSSYLSLWFWRRTWPAARMMSLAWYAPVRYCISVWRGRQR